MARTLRFDPRERVAVVATRLAGRSEEVVGVGTMDRARGEPELVVADEARAPGALDALEQALRAHSR